MDDIILQKGGIRISRTLANFGQTSYPINGIGSVRVESPSRGGRIAVGVSIAAFGLFNMSSSMQGSTISGIIGVGILVALSSAFMPYKLMLRTASGDQQAYSSTDANEIGQLKSAIETAVIQRG